MPCVSRIHSPKATTTLSKSASPIDASFASEAYDADAEKEVEEDLLSDDEDRDILFDSVVKNKKVRKSNTSTKSLLNSCSKRPLINISGPVSNGPQTVTVISNERCLIHNRPTKRPRTAYDQSNLYLKPGQSYQMEDVKGTVVKPAYRDLYQNHALGRVLVEWMWETIFGAHAASLDAWNSIPKILSKATSYYHSILEHMNPPSSAVFLALHYIERGAQVGLAYNNFNANNLRGRSDQHIALYVTWMFLIALLVAFKHVAPEDVNFAKWVDKMFLEAHHIETMERQFTMMLDDDLSIPHSDWVDFLHSILSFTKHESAIRGDHRSAVVDVIIDEITVVKSFYKDSTQAFILPHAHLDDDSGPVSSRNEGDINHIAVVLTILIAHTINVNFDEAGLPYARREARAVDEAKTDRVPTPTSPNLRSDKEIDDADEKKPKLTRSQSLLGNGMPVFTPPTPGSPKSATASEKTGASSTKDEFKSPSASPKTLPVEGPVRCFEPKP